jgi:NO-binding membrane sensor protein with MHYT domain
LSIILVLCAFAFAIFLLWRLRAAPTIYWLTAALIGLALAENHYIGNSCKGSCDIRVDLILVVPILVLAIILCGIAYFKNTRGSS